jgi:hypothetical protein
MAPKMPQHHTSSREAILFFLFAPGSVKETTNHSNHVSLSILVMTTPSQQLFVPQQPHLIMGLAFFFSLVVTTPPIQGISIFLFV